MNLDRMETETALKIFEVVESLDCPDCNMNILVEFSDEEYQSMLYMIKRFKAYLPNANELRSE